MVSTIPEKKFAEGSFGKSELRLINGKWLPVSETIDHLFERISLLEAQIRDLQSRAKKRRCK